MNKLHWKKGIACGGMFLALLGLTFYILLSDQDPGQAMDRAGSGGMVLAGCGRGLHDALFLL